MKTIGANGFQSSDCYSKNILAVSYSEVKNSDKCERNKKSNILKCFKKGKF